MARDKYAKWGRKVGDLKHATRTGRESFAASLPEDLSASWKKCTDLDPNRGTVRIGRSSWAKPRVYVA